MDVASGFAFGYDPTGRSVIFMSKACAKNEGSEKVFYFIEERLIQGIAELMKRKVSGAVGVRFFYSLLKAMVMTGI